jgi:hypothetical protein
LRKVKEAHVPLSFGELSLKEGDVLIQLSEPDARGFAKGMMKSGALGIYPVAKAQDQ